jgi:hypothetical protein
MRSRHLALALFLPALLLSAGTPKSGKKGSGPVRSAKEAKTIAEQETGGKAVSARRIPLNGASGGWEVDVQMPRETKGWRCVIDADTHLVHSKTRIEQPGAKGKSEGPIRVVKGAG